jgi:membrane protease YdiL (CAAX protease family)
MKISLAINIIFSIGFILLFVLEAVSDHQNCRSIEDVLTGKCSWKVLIKKLIMGISIIVITILVICFTIPEIILFKPPVKNELWGFAWIIALFFSAIIGIVSVNQKSTVLDKSTRPIISLFSFPIYYILIRGLFITVYELFFRGVLLQSVLNEYGITYAIIINLIFYSMAHLFSSGKEIAGTIPFGLLLCFLTIRLQSIWPAVTVHLALALSHETKLVHHQKILN